jgi:hypothetical protein
MGFKLRLRLPCLADGCRVQPASVRPPWLVAAQVARHHLAWRRVGSCSRLARAPGPTARVVAPRRSERLWRAASHRLRAAAQNQPTQRMTTHRRPTRASVGLVPPPAAWPSLHVLTNSIAQRRLGPPSLDHHMKCATGFCQVYDLRAGSARLDRLDALLGRGFRLVALAAGDDLTVRLPNSGNATPRWHLRARTEIVGGSHSVSSQRSSSSASATSIDGKAHPDLGGFSKAGRISIQLISHPYG